MATEIKMPQLGETVVEGTITKWLKQKGDSVEADEYIVEVSTDKVDSEVPSSASGVIQEILVEEGETVSVGTAIAIVDEGGEAAGEEAGGSSEAAESETAEGETEKEPAAAEQPAAEPAAEKPSSEAPKERGDGDTSKRGIISPLVRRLADEHDVSLDEVEGTGTGGRIRKQDVLRFVEERKAKPQAKPAAQAEPAPEPRETASRTPAATPSGTGREELVPWTNIRRRTAEHMVASHLETARAWNAAEADWSNVVAVRERTKAAFREKEGFNLTYMPMLAKLLSDTLLEMPEVNATYDEEHGGNRVKHYVNMGIAVALEGGGLIVPVVKGADERNLVGIARGINDLVVRARTKKLIPDDLQGGTFTITNPGPFGSIISLPIIPQGQTAILGFEAIEKRVVVTEDDAIAIRSMGFLSLSWDHRIIDGAEAAKFLARLKERIETHDFTSELAQYL
ncbi:MAG: 2-oxo acid dehydrogenase subunit E2 [Actinobacteria bacterium]|nr:2-oxo acid dehydrogenase subunit E2 [Actinomycetota bacterium]